MTTLFNPILKSLKLICCLLFEELDSHMYASELMFFSFTLFLTFILNLFLSEVLNHVLNLTLETFLLYLLSKTE